MLKFWYVTYENCKLLFHETTTAWKLKYSFRNYISSLWTAIACITAKLFFLGINWKLGPLSVIRIHTTKRHSSYELTATLLWPWLWSFQFDNLIKKDCIVKKWITKGQLISKQNCWAITSPKKSWARFVCFLEKLTTQ